MDRMYLYTEVERCCHVRLSTSASWYGSKHVRTCVTKIVIKILQGSAVTETVVGGGLTINPPIANFL